MTAFVNEQLASAERQRCDALLTRDVEALGNLLDDELIHVHTNGQTETKQQYLAGVAQAIEFIQIDRLSSDTKIFDDFAILRGRIDQIIRVQGHTDNISLSIYATIVWHRRNDWRVVSYQATIVSGSPP